MRSHSPTEYIYITAPVSIYALGNIVKKSQRDCKSQNIKKSAVNTIFTKSLNKEE